METLQYTALKPLMWSVSYSRQISCRDLCRANFPAQDEFGHWLQHQKNPVRVKEASSITKESNTESISVNPANHYREPILFHQQTRWIHINICSRNTENSSWKISFSVHGQRSILTLQDVDYTTDRHFYAYACHFFRETGWERNPK